LGLFGPGSSAAVGLVARTALCIAGHVGAAVALWRRAVQVDLSRRSEITSAYMYVWKLFYLEYLLIPLLP
jgi:homogentisate phytyltransferase/homogentisate geranylgeranyltransferase